MTDAEATATQRIALLERDVEQLKRELDQEKRRASDFRAQIHILREIIGEAMA